jgi:phage I-like protein
MTHPRDPLTVLAAAIDLPDTARAPEWVHLLPTAKGRVTTFDGRGPYEVMNAEAIIAASMENPRGIPVDVNHSTNLAAPEGREAPAYGWVKQMEVRSDGVWGRVEWTKAGRELVEDKAYRGISPVITVHPDRRTVRLIPCVSLVNKPNLRGLTALHQETSMDFMAKMAKALGLPDDATEEAIMAAIAEMKGKKSDPDMVAMQSALTEMGTVLGIEGGNATAIVAAVKGKVASTQSLTVLQAENAVLKGRVDTMEAAGKRAASEAYVKGEFAKKRDGLKADNLETFITLHMEQPAVAVKIVENMRVLGDAGVSGMPPTAGADGKLTALNAEQTRAAALLNIEPAKYLDTLNAERASKLEIV